MSMKETIDKAYGSIPKEVGFSFTVFEFWPARPVKYFWLTQIWRKFFR